MKYNWLAMKKGEKKPESDKNTNYKSLITQFYEKDNHLADVRDQVKPITPEIDILDELNDFEKKIDALIKTYLPYHTASATTCRRCT